LQQKSCDTQLDSNYNLFFRRREHFLKKKKVKPRIPEGEAILDDLDFTMEDYSKTARKMLKGEYNRFIKFVVNDLGVNDNSKVLEIGPGPGWIGIWMAKTNISLKIIGLEISEDMIRVANKNKESEGVQDRVSFVLGNGKDMKQFSDNSFDVVISNGNLHHWEDSIQVFNEIYRVLKKDGIFCVSDGRRDLDWRGKLIFHIFKYFGPKFMRIGWKTSIMAGYTPKEVKEMLDKSNLRDKWQLTPSFMDFSIHNKLNNKK